MKLQTYSPTQLLSCEYCEIFKNIYFEQHLRTAASNMSVTNLITQFSINLECALSFKI